MDNVFFCKFENIEENLNQVKGQLKSEKFKSSAAEYKCSFETDYSKAEIQPDPTEKEKLQLTIDGVSDTNWFRQKYKEFQEAIRIKSKLKPEVGKSKGFRM